METMTIMPEPSTAEEQVSESKTDNQFIQANTSPISIGELRGSCIIPSFAKDNESTISHSHFIEAVYNAAQMTFEKKRISDPVIRVSHPVKGRVPSAMGKPAKLLTEHEKTLYFERMAFLIEVPSIRDSAGGNDLSLTVGGVRSYSETNLYSKKTVEQRNTFEDLRVEKMRTLQSHYQEYNERLGHLFQLYNEQETWFYQQETQMVSKIDKSIVCRY